jgi:hypothetical protein
MHNFVYRKANTDQHRNGNEFLISKGNTVACPFSMFNRYLTISETRSDSNMVLLRSMFRSCEEKWLLQAPTLMRDVGRGMGGG